MVLSHGHLDHTWGLVPLVALLLETALNARPVTRPVLVSHPMAFQSRSVPGIPEIGSIVDVDRLARQFHLALHAEPHWVTRDLVFLGEIPRVHDFEAAPPLGTRHTPNGDVPDSIPDDSGMACVTDKGLVVITGCAHSGVCNMVTHAQVVTGVQRVRAIIGGMHLLEAPRERLEKTAAFLRPLELEALYPCHCTDLAAKIALARHLPVTEVGVGLRLEFGAA